MRDHGRNGHAVPTLHSGGHPQRSATEVEETQEQFVTYLSEFEDEYASG